jgi:Rieske Fe-S protein
MATISSDLSRRGFLLLQTLKGAIGLTLVVIIYPVAWFLRPRKATTSGALEVVAPFKVNQLATTTSNPFDFGGKPCLVVLTPEGAARLASGQSPGPDDVRAFNAVCTHVDCTVKFRPATGDIFCNCHEGTYNLNGQNVAGPPPRPLEAYRVTLRGEKGQEEIVVSKRT